MIQDDLTHIEVDFAPASSTRQQRLCTNKGRAAAAASLPGRNRAERTDFLQQFQDAGGRDWTRISCSIRRTYPVIVVAEVAGLLILPASMRGVESDDDNAAPSLQESAPSLMERRYLFGNWDGERDRLADQGITFDFNNIGDFLTDVSGSQTHHATYFGRFRASTDIDFNKLANFDGEFFFSGIWQYGYNLSGAFLHVNTLSSSIAGTESLRFDQLWYQQGFFHDLFKLKVGQIVPVNEFGETDFFDILFNDELGYAPNALFYPKQPFSPAGKPGAILRTDLSAITPGLYFKAGIATAYRNPYRPDNYGVDYGNDFNYGAVASFEIGYQLQNTVYKGIFKAGINGNDLDIYSNPATGVTYRGDFTAYAVAQKTVYHPKDSGGKLDLNKGLDLFVEYVGGPGDRNPLSEEFLMGARYTGLIPGRDHDKTGFGFIYSENGAAFSEAYNALHGHGLGGEATVELDYQYNPAPWFSLQPDLQLTIDPGGDAYRSLITVLGLRTIVRF
jgi:porin